MEGNMKLRKTLSWVAAAAVAPTSLLADGYERTNIDTTFMYESGSYAEFGFGRVAPDIAGRTTTG